MNDCGFISLDRKILKWEWYDDVNTMRIFLHLLLTVNYEDGRWHGLEIKRGQRITSTLKLAKELHLSRQAVRTSLNHLKSTNEITNEPTSNYSLITVLKYNEYQSNNRRINQRSTNDQPTINQRSTTIKQEEQEQQRKQEEQREGASAPTPTETMKDFVLSVSEKNERYQNLIQKISERWQIPAEKVSAEFDKFTNYWCERTRDGKRERWQTEKVFEVQRRLVTWFQNVQKFSGLNGRSEKKGIRIIS